MTRELKRYSGKVSHSLWECYFSLTKENNDVRLCGDGKLIEIVHVYLISTIIVFHIV